MKERIAKMIKIIGIGHMELIMDFELDIYSFNSIEWDNKDGKVYLHIFTDEDLDVSYDFDDLSEDDQLSVFQMLSNILYN